MAELIEIWRHPIKSHGREKLSSVELKAYQTLPLDREWAVAHEKSDADGSIWASCQNFSRGSKAPMLAAVNAKWEDATRTMTLTHPRLSELTFDPYEKEGRDRFIEWARPLIPKNRAQSTRLVHATKRGMTDTDYPSVTIGNLASHRAVSQKLGRPLSHLRWRCNFWLEGLSPWEEFEWVGKNIQIGKVIFQIKEPVERCLATTANPENGQRDTDILGTLQTWGHKNFTVYATVGNDGLLKIGDRFKAL